MSGKEIWLPKSETSVRVQDGQVTVWEDMKMSPQPIGKPNLGFRDPATKP